MDIQGYQWMPMEVFWISMDIHGNPLISIDIHGRWIPQDIYEAPRNTKLPIIRGVGSHTIEACPITIRGGDLLSVPEHLGGSNPLIAPHGIIFEGAGTDFPYFNDLR
jgi:hypothetical protein